MVLPNIRTLRGNSSEAGIRTPTAQQDVQDAGVSGSGRAGSGVQVRATAVLPWCGAAVRWRQGAGPARVWCGGRRGHAGRAAQAQAVGGGSKGAGHDGRKGVGSGRTRRLPLLAGLVELAAAAHR